MANHTGPDDHKDIDWSSTKLIARRITRARSREREKHLAQATGFLKTDNLRNHDNISNKTLQIFIIHDGKTLVLHACTCFFRVISCSRPYLISMR